ncbi:MAG: tryptophan 7-halogenase [Pseudomonadota bacterium]
MTAMAQSRKTIIICGDGLAGLMTARALDAALSDAFRIILVSVPEPHQEIVYGSTTSPTAYEFLRMLELSEPVLFTRTSTSFCWGTQYRNWPGATPAWMQCHHQPFPALAGVPLQHHLTRNQRDLSPLLISAAAAGQGKFAHPPEDRTHPLSRAEYGYQFSASEWGRLLKAQLSQTRVELKSGPIGNVLKENGEISKLVLAAGETLAGDMYIDCTGAERTLLSSLNVAFEAARRLRVQSQIQPVQGLGPPCKIVEANATGWRSQTHLQNSVSQIIVTAETDAQAPGAYTIGRVSEAWTGNCVAIGASAATQDPLTVAPMVMLQRDIERLLELIPVGSDAAVERNEFNRRFEDDVTHSGLFSDAFYLNVRDEIDPFWTVANAASTSDKLNRKRTQFESRGVLAKYDLEPFNDEDWIVLHHGLGHRAKRYDLQIESVSQAEMDQQLDLMAGAIEQTVSRMPPHHMYVSNMKRYFEKQQYA